MDNEPARSYYISDFAYGRLIGMAQRNRFVEYGSNRVRGMSKFLNYLSVMPMNDTCPDLVKERHIQEIKNNRAPSWSHTRLRRNRLLKLTDDAIERYILVAWEMDIIRAEPWAKGGPDRSTPYPTISIVLEAIGLGWITPEMFPTGNIK